MSSSPRRIVGSSSTTGLGRTTPTSSTADNQTMRIRPDLPRSGTFSVSSTSRANSHSYTTALPRTRGASVELTESPISLTPTPSVRRTRGDPFLVRVVIMVDNATEPGISDAASVKHRESIVKLIRDDNSHGSEIPPGQAVAFAIRKRLKSEEEVAVLNTLTLLDELMRTVPYFYRFIATDKFFRRLWRFVDPDYKSGVKSMIPIFAKTKIHQGMRGSQSEISQRVKVLIRAWAEELSVMFNGRYDPDAGFLIERYNNKQSRVPFPEVPKTQLPWVCPVKTNDFLRPQNRQRGRASASKQAEQLSLAEVENTVNLFSNLIDNATNVNDLREDACTELYTRCKTISDNITKLSMNMSKEEELTRAISISETLQKALTHYRSSVQTGKLTKPRPTSTQVTTNDNGQSEDEGYDDEYDKKMASSSRSHGHQSDGSDNRYYDATSTPVHLSESSDFSSAGERRHWRERDYNRERDYERENSRERSRDWDRERSRDRPRPPSLEQAGSSASALPPLPSRRSEFERIQRMNSEKRTRPSSDDEFARREKSESDLGRYITSSRVGSSSRRDNMNRDLPPSSREISRKESTRKESSKKETSKKSSSKKELSKKESTKKSNRKETNDQDNMEKETLISVPDENGDLSDSSTSRENAESFDMLASRYSSKKTNKSSKSKPSTKSRQTSALRSAPKNANPTPMTDPNAPANVQPAQTVPPAQMYLSAAPGMGMNPMMMMPNPYAMYGSVSPVPMQDPMAMMAAYQTVNPAMYYASMNPHMYGSVTPNMQGVPGTPANNVMSSNNISPGQTTPMIQHAQHHPQMNTQPSTPQQHTAFGAVPPQSPLPPAGSQSVSAQAPVPPTSVNPSQMGSFYGSMPGGVNSMQTMPPMSTMNPMMGQVGIPPVQQMMFPPSNSFTQLPQTSTAGGDQTAHAVVYQNAMNQAAAAYHAAASAYQSMHGQAPIMPSMNASAPGSLAPVAPHMQGSPGMQNAAQSMPTLLVPPGAQAGPSTGSEGTSGHPIGFVADHDS